MRIVILTILLLINPGISNASETISDLAKLDSSKGHALPGIDAEMPYPKVNVKKVFAVFLDAVDRGQMKIFDDTLSREMLTPLRVEYVYTLQSPYPLVKVYAELNEPMPIPSMPDANIIGVSGVMDATGNIIETTAHCDVYG